MVFRPKVLDMWSFYGFPSPRVVEPTVPQEELLKHHPSSHSVLRGLVWVMLN